MAGSAWMMTRHGRSASTVSTVLLNTVAPLRAGKGMTIAFAPISIASSTISRPAPPARIFSQCPVTRRPPWSLACSMMAWAASS